MDAPRTLGTLLCSKNFEGLGPAAQSGIVEGNSRAETDYPDANLTNAPSPAGPQLGLLDKGGPLTHTEGSPRPPSVTSLRPLPAWCFLFIARCGSIFPNLDLGGFLCWGFFGVFFALFLKEQNG